MTLGILEVTLVNGRGLKSTELFGGGIDPYVVLQYKGQERKSSVAQGNGSRLEWNEKFTFRVEYPGADDQYKLILTVMDKDTFSADDHLGQSIIYLKDLLELGVESGTAALHPCKYSVVDNNQTYCGEIQVGITFTPKVQADGCGEEYGGWRQSET